MIRAALWWAAALALLVWWGPAILLALAGLLLGRARYAAASALVDLLRALGLRDAARAVLRAELRRCRRRMAELARS